MKTATEFSAAPVITATPVNVQQTGNQLTEKEMKKYKNKYRNDSTRLKYWDYGSNGWYFITICTQNPENYFGEIIETQNIVGTQNIASPQLQPTDIGAITQQYWIEIPHHFPFVKLDEFVIMPNHVHGILLIDKPENPWTIPVFNKFGPQSQNLSSVIRGYKAAVKKYATLNNISFGWQSRFHDRIIRSDKELHTIRWYIKNNATKWFQEIDTRTEK